MTGPEEVRAVPHRHRATWGQEEEAGRGRWQKEGEEGAELPVRRQHREDQGQDGGDCGGLAQAGQAGQVHGLWRQTLGQVLAKCNKSIRKQNNYYYQLV